MRFGRPSFSAHAFATRFVVAFVAISCEISVAFSVSRGMGNDPRWVPPDSLVEIMQKTLHGRYLLRPSRELVDLFNGVLIRAAERYSVEVCAFVCLSNHSHLLVLPEDAEALSAFMTYFAGNLAKEVGRLHDWPQKIYGRRYTHVITSDEPEAQEERLRYLLSNSCKEGLVKRPQDWPGPSSVEALLTGTTVRGVWFDRSAEYEARRSKRRFRKYEFAEVHDLQLAPIPAWKHLDPEERKTRVRTIVRDITREAYETAKTTGRAPLGVRRVLAQHPHSRPETTKSSTKPIVHAATRKARQRMLLDFRLFRKAYRLASAALRRGDFEVTFPPGCHRPRLPFVHGRPPPQTAA